MQCQLPLSNDEIDLQFALTSAAAGEPIDNEIARHLVGVGYLRTTTKRLVVTDEGSAFLDSLVDVPVDLPPFLQPAARAS